MNTTIHQASRTIQALRMQHTSAGPWRAKTAVVALLLCAFVLPACGATAAKTNDHAGAAATATNSSDAAAPAGTATSMPTPTSTVQPRQMPAATQGPKQSTAVIATLTVLPTPQATPGVSKSTSCGNYTVTQYVTNVLNTGRVTRVSITDGQGHEVKQFTADTTQGAMVGITRVRCGELTGDGVPDVIVETYTGGANCCFVYDIVALQTGVPSLLHWDARKGGIKEFALLAGKPPYQIVGVDDRLADLDLVPLYATPDLPVVFTLRNGTYVQATQDYPKVLRENLAEALQAIPPCNQDETCERSQAVRAYAIGHWLGEDASTLTRLKALVSPAVYSWLGGVRDKVDKALAG